MPVSFYLTKQSTKLTLTSCRFESSSMIRSFPLDKFLPEESQDLRQFLSPFV